MPEKTKTAARKKDGSKCDGRPVGDLTITVTNEKSSLASDLTSFKVTYTQ